MPKPDDVGVGTALLVLNEEGELLLGKRKGAHRAGHWCCPGGWLDRDDTSTESAVIREALEETSLVVKWAEPFCWTTEDHPELGVRTVTLYHITGADHWEGTPQVAEPEKCDEWRWFSLLDLPHPLFPTLDGVVKELQERLFQESLDDFTRPGGTL
jgi:8-oxo-dGTP diphosphatase